MNERALLHPVTLAALTTLVLNDHVLKWTWPGWITGKLSDVAGLILVPIVLAAVLRVTRRDHLVVCALIPALLFAAVKIDPRATALWCDALACGRWLVATPLELLRHGGLPSLHAVDAVTDRSDLLALPATLALLRVVGARSGSARAADFAIAERSGAEHAQRSRAGS